MKMTAQSSKLKALSQKLVALLLLAIALVSCQPKQEYQQSVIFNTEELEPDSNQFYDLADIQASGTLIAGTLSGPETYYEYRGKEMGLQFQLAEEFAQSIGAKLQMEIAPDTATLLKRLQKGEIDFIALEMPRWLTRDEAPMLREAIRQWWKPLRVERLIRTIAQMSSQEPVRRRSRPFMMNPNAGIISQYDDLFRKHASAVGLDWRLIAAVSFQESGFDPQATSWAGAKGLMQLMPGTAKGLGVDLSMIYDPNVNIEAGCHCLKKAYNTFNDIPDPQERMRFALAGYNGGSNHIRDAMALTQKYGQNPHVWSHVSRYVLLLQQPEYYRDPVVKYGYMRGSETEAYVDRIIDRWQQYCSSVRGGGKDSMKPAPARSSMKQGEYKSQVKSADEWVPEEQPSSVN